MFFATQGGAFLSTMGKIKTKKNGYVQIENIKTKTLQMKVFEFQT